MESAVSVKPYLKTHESNNSLNACPVVKEETDEDVMDDEEEPSEESRPERAGQCRVKMPTVTERQEHERTHLSHRSWCRHCVTARGSNVAHRGRKFPIAIEEDKDKKQTSASCETIQEWDQQRVWFRRTVPPEWFLHTWHH